MNEKMEPTPHLRLLGGRLQQWWVDCWELSFQRIEFKEGYAGALALRGEWRDVTEATE
jgi:hypothetical protein